MQTFTRDYFSRLGRRKPNTQYLNRATDRTILSNMTHRQHKPPAAACILDFPLRTPERCNQWPRVGNRLISITLLLSSCCYLFTVSNSGLLSMQRPRPVSPAHFRFVTHTFLDSSVVFYLLDNSPLTLTVSMMFVRGTAWAKVHQPRR